MAQRNDYLKFLNEYDAISKLGQVAMTYADMEHEFGWRRRSAERRIAQINEYFPGALHREKTPDGRTAFSLRLNREKLATIISENDIEDICGAAKILKNKSLEKLGNKLKNFDRVAGMNVDDIILATGAVSRPGPKININVDIVRALSNAIKLRQRVEMKYTTRAGEKHHAVVAPLGWLHGAQKMYLVADKTKNIGDDVRTFLVNNITSVKILDDNENYFDADDFNIDDFAARSFGLWVESDKPDGYDIEWYVPAEHVDAVDGYIFHKTQEFYPNKDGSLTIKFHAGGLLEMAWHLFTWGGKIIPVAPIELVNKYRECIALASESLNKKI